MVSSDWKARQNLEKLYGLMWYEGKNIILSLNFTIPRSLSTEIKSSNSENHVQAMQSWVLSVQSKVYESI